MKKISVNAIHEFCPQAMYLYGTYKEDGNPNFGLFSWFGYCLDGGVRVMAAVGSGKLTSDRIRASGVFSANLVSESLLPLADYCGNTMGYDEKKMDIPVNVEKGAVLPVPVLADSPWTYELEVERTVSLSGSDIFICKISNVLVAEELPDVNIPFDERLRRAAPAIAFGGGYYAALKPGTTGKWGDWKGLREAAR
ncbi:MAG: flavin reductase family protein [Oscillospiraceae bacterium]|jgi:flavin reductase (DIM6/NTAB) family NADH-FMN oxidoreductase RutF|nr:flavin reductase family protein [Oscillospiraceae bacterium]